MKPEPSFHINLKVKKNPKPTISSFVQQCVCKIDKLFLKFMWKYREPNQGNIEEQS